VAAILVAGFAAYANSFAGVFVFDDRTALAANPFIRTLWPVSQAARAPRDTALAGRPVASVSFAVSYALAPDDVRELFFERGGLASDRVRRNAAPYHAINVAIHLLAALTLFGVARRTLINLRPRGGLGGTEVVVPALAIALIWVVHPLTTSAVTYIVQRTEALAGLFYLLTLYCALRACTFLVLRSSFSVQNGAQNGAQNDERRTTNPNAERRTKNQERLWLVCAVLACALGMATKESVVTAPVMVVAWDYLFVDMPWREIVTRRWRLYLALAATWVVLAAIVMSAPRSASVGFGLEGVSAWSYLLTQAGVVAHYLRLALVPWPLCLDYEWPIARSLSSVAVPGLVVLSLLAVTLWGLARRARWSFAGVWFFLILAPTSSIVPIVTEVAADHRMYLALAAVIAAVLLVARRRASGIEALAVAAVVVLLALLTHARNEDYTSQERIYAQTVTAAPWNARARNNLASVLIEQGRTTDAEAQLQEAVRLRPDYADALANLAVAHVVDGRVADSLPLFARATTLRPDHGETWRNYAEALGAAGKSADAVRAYRRALAVDADDANAMEGLAWILATSADDSVRDPRAAMTLAERAARANETSPNALDTLAAAYAANERFADAIATAGRALAAARAANRADLVDQIQHRLELYRRGETYRQIRPPP